MRTPIRLLALFAAAGFPVFGVSQSKPIVIEGARIVTGTGRVIETGSILIADGILKQVGVTVDKPAGSELFQAKGLTVYPGFIDAYSSRGLKLPTPPSSESRDTTSFAPASMLFGNRKGVRPELLAADCLDLETHAGDWMKQGVTSVFLAPGTGTFRGQGVLTAAVPNTEKVKHEYVKSFGQMIAFATSGGEGYPTSLMGFISLIRQTLLDAQRHAALASPPKSDWLDSLKSLVKGTTPALFYADSGNEIVRALSLCKEFSLRPILVGAREAYQQIPLIKSSGARVIASVAIGSEPPKKNPEGEAQRPQELLNEAWESWHSRAQNLIRLSEAGVSFALTSEGDSGQLLPNLRRIIKLGLSKETALRALTQGAAEMFGVANRIGTIEVGKSANLVLMTGDFADEKSAVQAVVIDGQKFEVDQKGGAR